MQTIQKPLAGEYVPYAIMYIDLVPADGLVLEHLEQNLRAVKELVAGQPEEKLTTPCAAGEWTIKEVLVHVSDTERVFGYRALRFARNDTTALPGFDQDAYAAASDANERDIADILAELSAVRAATLALFKSFRPETLEKSGQVNGYNVSVRALAYMAAGHELHHLNSIKENYFSES